MRHHGDGSMAKTLQLYGLLDPKRVLEVGKQAAFIAHRAQEHRSAGGATTDV
jgi:hypothetical protein